MPKGISRITGDWQAGAAEDPAAPAVTPPRQQCRDCRRTAIRRTPWLDESYPRPLMGHSDAEAQRRAVIGLDAGLRHDDGVQRRAEAPAEMAGRTLQFG